MKKIVLTLGSMFALFLMACEGPEGPPGPPGYDGEDGVNIVGQAFEIEADLSLDVGANTYQLLFEPFPSNVEVLSSDVVLIYRLEEVADTDNGPVDVWRQLPQPFFTDAGTMFYNFDFTVGDFSIYAEPDFDAGLVPIDLVTDQVFRIVVVPADFTSEIDPSSLPEVMGALGLKEMDVKKIDFQ